MTAVKIPAIDMSLDHARTVLMRAAFTSDEDLRVAAQYLVDYGDAVDYQRGTQMLRQLQREREAASIFATAEDVLADQHQSTEAFSPAPGWWLLIGAAYGVACWIALFRLLGVI